jgi:hypothetical protein
MAGNRAGALEIADRLEAKAPELDLPRYAEALRLTVADRLPIQRAIGLITCRLTPHSIVVLSVAR